MPLRDHFRPPWSDHNLWEGFHSAWINTMVRHLNGSVLPRRYRAVPQVHLGPFVESDVPTFERDEFTGSGGGSLPAGESGNGGAAALWGPPEAVQTLDIEFPAQDVFEVRVYDDPSGMRLVAAVELVSPANKDREEHRSAFVAKCAGYLQQQVGVVVVDIVTSRRNNLHQELLEMFGQTIADTEVPKLYSVSYRNRKDNGKWQLDLWPSTLIVGNPLPAVPLWLSSRFAVPLDLEKSYEETNAVLRIE